MLDQSEIEALFGGAPSSPPASSSASGPANAAERIGKVEVSAFKLDEIGTGQRNPNEQSDVSLILDVDLNVRIELGRTRMYIEDVLRLREGSVVPLEKLAGDPVDIFVNGRLMARGEVLVLNDNFCVRVSEILGDSKSSGPDLD
ncbi:flagellar motor switch protein FliN [bacterium]|nr:flagellar motor switch protein FliN [bacterium]